VAGKRRGRSSTEQITLYKPVGVAVQDSAAAALVLRAAHQRGAGHEVELFAVVNPCVGGSHGDMAQALALAVYELRRGSTRKRLPRSGKAVYARAADRRASRRDEPKSFGLRHAASHARCAISTFSCDIARSVSRLERLAARTALTASD
jgi:Ornithine cyclodeaminase/mu-crystallin family